jgi:hypothetical protein
VRGLSGDSEHVEREELLCKMFDNGLLGRGGDEDPLRRWAVFDSGRTVGGGRVRIPTVRAASVRAENLKAEKWRRGDAWAV